MNNREYNRQQCAEQLLVEMIDLEEELRNLRIKASYLEQQQLLGIQETVANKIVNFVTKWSNDYKKYLLER